MKIAEKPLPNLFDSENDCSSDDNSVVGKESECNSREKKMIMLLQLATVFVGDQQGESSPLHKYNSSFFIKKLKQASVLP